MELKQIILNTEEIVYSSNLKIENLKENIKNLFEQNTSLSIVGKLTNRDEFTAYDKSVVINWSMPNLRRKSAYLSGKITEVENGSLIKLKVTPNTFLPVFGFFAILVGIVLTGVVLVSKVSFGKFSLFFGLGLTIVGIVYYTASTFYRNKLKNKVVKYLSLRKE